MHGGHDKPASFHSSPQEAVQAPPEEFLYLACLHEGTGVEAPDFLAVVDAEAGRVVHETPMPNVGDELHHFGWNRCSSACHGPDRSHLIVPGFRSSRIHIVSVADDPRAPRIEKVIEPEEIVAKTGYTRPHTVHCMPGDNVVVSMLGDADGNGAGGFAVLDAKTFDVKGRWENGGETPPLNYDFWYQPRKNVLVSSEFGEPNAYEPGFDIDDVGAGRYGQRLHFWNLAERRLEQTIDLGEQGLVPLEVRWLHDPEAEQGFVGATLASNILRFHRSNGAFQAEPVIEVDNVELEGWPLPGGVPGLITDVVLSMDDRFLYLSNWLHGDLRQYDISDPTNPRLTGRLWLGAAPASAFTPPELYVRLQSADITHEPASDWIPLAAVPQLDYIGGYQIGYRLQPTGTPTNFQRAALSIAAVPDGQPTQPRNLPPYCVGQAGAAGTITPVGSELQFEGDGRYTISVSVGPDGGPTDCLAGPTTAASFTVDVRVAPEEVGVPFAFRATPLPGDPFVGVRAASPPGGFADHSCAVDATINPDGSVTGRRVVPQGEPPRETVTIFPEPGAWTCVGRGVVEGLDESFESTFFGTPWSAPLRVEVYSDFRRVQTTIVRPRSGRPVFDITAEFRAASAGGKATLKLVRFVRCRRSGYLFKKAGTYKGTFDAKGHARLKIKRPRSKGGFYGATVSFGGTRFVRAGADPRLIPLLARPKRIEFVRPQDYPRC